MKICLHRSIKVKGARYWILAAAFYCLMPLACGTPSGKGQIEVRVKDHREAINDFSKVNITVESIRLSPKVGFRFWRLGWLTLNPSLDQFDLTRFVNNSGVAVFKGAIDSGAFEAFDLKLRSVRGTVKKDSSVVSIDNKVTPLALSFSVNPGEPTLITLDLAVMDMSDHPPATYELQLKGYEIYNNGKLVDKIPPG